MFLLSRAWTRMNAAPLLPDDANLWISTTDEATYSFHPFARFFKDLFPVFLRIELAKGRIMPELVAWISNMRYNLELPRLWLIMGLHLYIEIPKIMEDIVGLSYQNYVERCKEPVAVLKEYKVDHKAYSGYCGSLDADVERVYDIAAAEVERDWETAIVSGQQASATVDNDVCVADILWRHLRALAGELLHGHNIELHILINKTSIDGLVLLRLTHLYKAALKSGLSSSKWADMDGP